MSAGPGTRFREHPTSVVRKIAKRYERVATFEELPGHGHWLIGEPGGQKIAERIDQWLRQILNRPA